MPSETPLPAILGVYSLRQVSEIGSGVTIADHRNVTYWYVRQLSETLVEVQPLTVDGLPSGITKNVGFKKFITTYTPEPLYYAEHPQPILDSLAAKLLEGGEDASLIFLDPQEFDVLDALLCAPLEHPDYAHPGYEDAHRVMMENIKRVLATLTCKGPGARFEQCVRFNRFAVTLRKDRRFEESIGFFTKALAIEKRDENLYFNMARVYYDKGDFQECGRVLEQALRLNPTFDEAGRFIRFLSRRENATS